MCAGREKAGMPTSRASDSPTSEGQGSVRWLALRGWRCMRQAAAACLSAHTTLCAGLGQGGVHGQHCRRCAIGRATAGLHRCMLPTPVDTKEMHAGLHHSVWSLLGCSCVPAALHSAPLASAAIFRVFISSETLYRLLPQMARLHIIPQTRSFTFRLADASLSSCKQDPLPGFDLTGSSPSCRHLVPHARPWDLPVCCTHHEDDCLHLSNALQWSAHSLTRGARTLLSMHLHPHTSLPSQHAQLYTPRPHTSLPSQHVQPHTLQQAPFKPVCASTYAATTHFGSKPAHANQARKLEGLPFQSGCSTGHNSELVVRAQRTHM